MRIRSLRAALACALTFVVAAPVSSAIATSATDELDELVNRRANVETSLARATAAYEEAHARVEAAQGELDSLEDRRAELKDVAVGIEDQLNDRARSLFMHGESVMSELTAATSPGDAVNRAGMLSVVSSRDKVELEQATNVREQLAETEALLVDRRDELAALSARYEDAMQDLEAELAAVKSAEQDLRTRRERQIELEQGMLNGTYSCIFGKGRSHFINSWGAPRGGGSRSHKGTDVMAPMNEPVYAITTGTVTRMNNSRVGGISLYIRGDDGHVYFYTHLNGYAPGLRVGQRVEAGQYVALNGATGNARGGSPHVHFEWHPGGGSARNPYSTLATLCF